MQWVVDDVIFYSIIFIFIANYMVMIIGLKKMVVSIVFGDVQFVFVNIIIDFRIYRRFKTTDK